MKFQILTIIFMLLVSMMCNAQTHSTKETKIVLAVNSKSDTVTHIILFNTFQKMEREEIFKIYRGSKFYIGLLRGSYEPQNNCVNPASDATIIMYTEKEFFPGEPFLSEDNLSAGDRLDLGKKKAEVVSSRRGELTLRIE